MVNHESGIPVAVLHTTNITISITEIHSLIRTKKERISESVRMNVCKRVLKAILAQIPGPHLYFHKIS